jgi:hypothetical protein
MKRKVAVGNIFYRDIPLVLFLVFTLFPFYWILNTSLKNTTEVFSIPVKYWPAYPTFENYRNLFENMGFNQYFLNSAFVGAFGRIRNEPLHVQRKRLYLCAASGDADAAGRGADDTAVPDHEYPGPD